jgi:hypothetical protein
MGIKTFNSFCKSLAALLLAAATFWGAVHASGNNAKKTAHDTLWNEGGDHWKSNTTDIHLLLLRVQQLERKTGTNHNVKTF